LFSFVLAPLKGYRVAISVPADTAQKNALSVLKKLEVYNCTILVSGRIISFSESEFVIFVYRKFCWIILYTFSFYLWYQIAETDANSDELCTRREFARWFVKLSSSLER
jgi:hypothetical protein